MTFEQGTKGYVVQDGRFVKARLESNKKDITAFVEQKVRLSARHLGGKIVYRGNAWEVDASGVGGITTTSHSSLRQSAESNSYDNAYTVRLERTPVVTKTSEERSKLQNYMSLQPNTIVLSSLKWTALCRAVDKGKNMLLVGEAGTGKTETVVAISEALDRELFRINLGSSQDPRAVLIGVMHFDKEKGTHFVPSEFVKAIQTPNAIVLLDEVSRAHPEAVNILMTVLDLKQRYLRLDEGGEIIKVHPTVSFLGTANIGMEYSATRKMDKALKSRFTFIEMEPMSIEHEFKFLSKKFDGEVEPELIRSIAEIAGATRSELLSTNPKISDSISTRHTIEALEFMQDGFTLTEVAELVFYPLFSPDGGGSSERTFVKQIVQKHLPNTATTSKLFGLSDVVD
jgi:MoxR-like ATPase